MISDKRFHNANKFAYLVQVYPEHTIEQIIALLDMTAIEINTAIWDAANAGWVLNIEDTEAPVGVGDLPEGFELGPDIEEMKNMLTLCFWQLSKKEIDLEEHYVSEWTRGHKAHDVMIALRQLLDDEILASYTLTDPKDTESVYTYYTLYANREQKWGRKSFKVQPEKNDSGAAAESEE